MRLKTQLRALAAALILAALLLQNGAIYYSSTPHYQQQGWAIFCSFNGIWIGVLGVLTLCFSESSEVAMRQLSHDRQYDDVELS